MGITEVCSPVSRKGSKVGSGQPLSPGARSHPNHAADSVPTQPKHGASPVKSHSEGDLPASTKVEGPEPTREDSVGVMQRLADRIMRRDRRTDQGYKFNNFPK